MDAISVSVLGSKGLVERATTEVLLSSKAVCTDVPEAFFLERYSAAYATEMAQFFGAVLENGPVPVTIEDGVKALELADAATRSWAEQKIITL
jgi:myo-inositol 2-dehydrogenase/D-chiro-inositol 1-dehydrogenase